MLFRVMDETKAVSFPQTHLLGWGIAPDMKSS
jgi:hypothetical protein